MNHRLKISNSTYNQKFNLHISNFYKAANAKIQKLKQNGKGS